MKLHLLGGVDTVTGSKHLVEINGARVLRDGGLYQGSREESRRRNREFSFDPAAVDALVLSHAHIDHCGAIPGLVRAGLRAPIHATTATVALCEIMLRDAAKIQEQDAAYLNQKTSRRGEPPVEPLYTLADAERALPLFRGWHYGKPAAVAPGLTVTFHDAGHILGAALTVFDLEEQGRRVRVGFAFDLGRRDLPLIRDPELIRSVDWLILESTYGNRKHDDVHDAGRQLRDAVRAALDRGGRVFIPTFALERAQEVIYHLVRLQASGELPDIPIHVDSPMAGAVTRVFEKSGAYLDDEFLALREQTGLVMLSPRVRFVSTVEESKAVTAGRAPGIVLAASGMCEHGRILHHLKHGIEDERNVVILVGFQAPQTLGRRLQEGARTVKIFGDEFVRRAQIVSLHAFSAHADRDDLLDYVRQVKPAHAVLVHGEADARAALAKTLKRELPALDVRVPREGDTLDL